MPKEKLSNKISSFICRNSKKCKDGYKRLVAHLKSEEGKDQIQIAGFIIFFPFILAASIWWKLFSPVLGWFVNVYDDVKSYYDFKKNKKDEE